MIYLNCGRRELGKTTLALFMAKKSARVVVFDPRHQFGVVPADEVVNDLPIDFSTFEADWQDGQPIIVIQPRDDAQGSVDALAAIVRDKLDREPALRLAVVLDEVALYDLDAWSFLFRCAPRDRLVLILTAHRPKDFSTTVRSLADTWCLFRMTQEHDLDVIEDRCGADVSQAVQGLQTHQFVAWDDARGTMTLYRDPALWFCDWRRKPTAIPEPVQSADLPDGGEVSAPPKKRTLF